jgi:hypothetical protein
MTREALADELSNLVERYGHSARALELFVRDSFRGIGRSQAMALAVLEKIRSALAGEEPTVTESGPGTVQIELSGDEVKALDEIVLEASRDYELHPQMLLEMSLVYAGALFDALISDVLLTLFRHIPERLRSGRTLTAEEALRFRDRDELIEELGRREVLDLTYKNVEKQFDYFRRSFGVDVFADESLKVSLADLAAVRERRNLVAHNNGLANAAYVANIDTSALVGDHVVTDAASAESDRVVLYKVAIALVSLLRHKLASPD